MVMAAQKKKCGNLAKFLPVIVNKINDCLGPDEEPHEEVSEYNSGQKHFNKNKTGGSHMLVGNKSSHVVEQLGVLMKWGRGDRFPSFVFG